MRWIVISSSIGRGEDYSVPAPTSNGESTSTMHIPTRSSDARWEQGSVSVQTYPITELYCYLSKPYEGRSPQMTDNIIIIKVTWVYILKLPQRKKIMTFPIRSVGFCVESARNYDQESHALPEETQEQYNPSSTELQS